MQERSRNLSAKACGDIPFAKSVSWHKGARGRRSKRAILYMPNTRYGLPYMGSKNTIAKDIVQFLPQRKNFYDLFAGGCAVCHAALESGKWQNIFANDITNAPKLFKEAITANAKTRLLLFQEMSSTFQKMTPIFVFVGLLATMEEIICIQKT